jgi:hypothetical protein
MICLCLLQVTMEVSDLLLTAIPITLGVTLILCCYFHKCSSARYDHMQLLYVASRGPKFPG